MKPSTIGRRFASNGTSATPSSAYGGPSPYLAELERWFPAAADWKPDAGEVFQAAGQHGEITELDPPHLISWAFAGNQYRIELHARDGGCLLVFTYVFDDRPAAAQWAAGWDTYLNRLEPHLAGGFLSEEDAHEGFLERNDHYADRFGLDPEIGRRFWRATHP